MRTYMNDKNLYSLTEEDLLFLVRAFADKHNEYDEIIHFAKSDTKVLIQMIDDEKVFHTLTNPEYRVLSVSTFFFFFQIIRHAFLNYSECEEFIEKVNLFQDSNQKEEYSKASIEKVLKDIDMQIYMANMLSFFSSSTKMNDPQKTQNGWLYITDLLNRIEEATPTNAFMLKAFIGNYTLCLTSFYKEYVNEKYLYGKRLLDCKYYSDYGQKYFVSASQMRVAEETGLSDTLQALGIAFHIVRIALDELKHKDRFYGCLVA